MRTIKILAVILAMALLTAKSDAGTEYSAAEAGKHVGESVTVTDKVDRVNKSSGGNVFMNLGTGDRDTEFTIFIPAKDADTVGDVQKYQGKTVSITGTITTHKDKPQIVVNAASQITMKEDVAEESSSAASTPTPTPTATPEE